MGSKVSMSKADALRFARDAGIYVRKISDKHYIVGDIDVTHTTGGKACWQVGPCFVGYVGEAIATAACIKAGITVEWDPRSIVGRKFREAEAWAGNRHLMDGYNVEFQGARPARCGEDY